MLCRPQLLAQGSRVWVGTDQMAAPCWRACGMLSTGLSRPVTSCRFSPAARTGSVGQASGPACNHGLHWRQGPAGRSSASSLHPLAGIAGSAGSALGRPLLAGHGLGPVGVQNRAPRGKPRLSPATLTKDACIKPSLQLTGDALAQQLSHS